MKTLIYRWRLWRICRKLKIKPMKWQKDYALGKFDHLCGHIAGRGTGKTMAVILYGLVRKIKTREQAEKLALRDPDTTRRDGSIYYKKTIREKMGGDLTDLIKQFEGLDETEEGPEEPDEPGEE